MAVIVPFPSLEFVPLIIGRAAVAYLLQYSGAAAAKKQVAIMRVAAAAAVAAMIMIRRRRLKKRQYHQSQRGDMRFRETEVSPIYRYGSTTAMFLMVHRSEKVK